MIMDKVRNKILSLIGVRKHFIFYGARNQNDNFFGKIIKVFPAIFIIELDNGQIRSYSYNDVLISNLKIVD